MSVNTYNPHYGQYSLLILETFLSIKINLSKKNVKDMI